MRSKTNNMSTKKKAKKTKKMSTGVELIALERKRQIKGEGWTAELDDECVRFELTQAASEYVRAAALMGVGIPCSAIADARKEWPFAVRWWKPSEDPIRNLVKAGALIAAEIDRLQRQEQ